MGLRKLLVALHPKAWREQYGEEFLAFLEQVDLGPAALIDVLRHAARLHAQARRRVWQICAALVVSVLFEVLALRLRLTSEHLVGADYFGAGAGLGRHGGAVAGPAQRRGRTARAAARCAPASGCAVDGWRRQARTAAHSAERSAPSSRCSWSAAVSRNSSRSSSRTRPATEVTGEARASPGCSRSTAARLWSSSPVRR